MSTRRESVAAAGLADRLTAFGEQVDVWTRELVRQIVAEPTDQLEPMLEYHLGWRDPDLRELETPAPGGKKLRPGIALLVSEAVCGDPLPARGAAVALELVHNFSLVHDDIQDASPLRRHRPTVWSLWGMEQGINVGDALFALAQVAVAGGAGERAAQLSLALNRACIRLSEGQFLDIGLQCGTVPLTLTAYEEMIARKTAALFSAAARLGAIAAGAEGRVVEAFGGFGHELGMAFQEQDDVLGVWGTEQETGKTAGADVVDRKKGLPASLALASPEAPVWLRDVYAAQEGQLDAGMVRRVIRYFDETGVRAAAEQRIEARFVRANALLDSVGGREPALSQLRELSQLLVNRRA